MSSPNALVSPAAVRLCATVCPAGCWRLKRGHAMTLNPRQAAELRLVHGEAWVTLGQGDAPAHGDAVAGDVFLRAGDLLAVPRGSRLVMEPLNPMEGSDLLFDWCDAPGAGRVHPASRFRRDVLGPAGELVQALRQVLQASARLLRGLLGYGEYVVAGRGRVLAPLEGNPP